LIADRDALVIEVEGYRQAATDMYKDLREDLTNYLVDRIEYHGRGFLNEFLPFDQMLDITEFVLADYLETPPELRGEVDVNGQLPWDKDDDV